MSDSSRRPIRSRRRTHRRLAVEKLNDRRVLAAIVGSVFQDLNESFTRDADEPAAASRLVFIDANENATLDVGEPIALTGPDGTFRFDNLADGTFSLRLFNGTASQRQTAPIGTDGLVNVVTITDGSQLVSTSNGTSLLTVDSVVTADLDNNQVESTFVAETLTDASVLPDGSLLVIGTNSSGDTAFRVDAADGSVSAVDLVGLDEQPDPDAPTVEFADLAIDGDGKGVVLEAANTPSPIRLIDASNPSEPIAVTVTDTLVPAGTSVVTSTTGPRSVFATPNGTGLDVSLFSNETGQFITGQPVFVEGFSELLAFDDASGLLAARTIGGGVGVLDTDANFETLHTVDGPVGPVAIDAVRDLLFAINPIDAILSLYDLTTGDLIVGLAVDFASIGTPVALAVGRSSDELVVLGAAGVAEIALDRPRAIEVEITNQQDVDSLLFGVAVDGENTAPRFGDEVPTFETDEDALLTAPQPGVLDGTVDDEGDDFVVVQVSDPENGSASTGISGGLTFQPDADFNGEDSFDVVLVDGRDASEVTSIAITVNSIPDSPEGILVDLPPTAEDIAINDAIGVVEVVDGDGPTGVTISIDDPRFGVLGDQVVFLGDDDLGGLDFETEPLIPLTITATDSQTLETVEVSVSLTITDANDPVTGIIPEELFVFENTPGASIDELSVVDQDLEQFHELTVDDDDRFIIDQFELRLADGVSLDFETEPVIVINVTATEFDTGNTFTQELTINVGDFPEQPAAVTLSNSSVTELLPGDVIGEVLVDGAPPSDRFDIVLSDPLFQINGTTLALAEGQFVKLDEAAQLEVEITVVDRQGEFADVGAVLQIDVLENPNPGHNTQNPADVNSDGAATPLDALVIINYLNQFGAGIVGTGDLDALYDVNGDGIITPLDALLVINQLSMSTMPAVVGEGESQPTQLDPPQQPPESEPTDEAPQQTQLSINSAAPPAPQNTPSPVQRTGQFVATDAAIQEDNQEAQPDPRLEETLRLMSDQ